MKYLEAKNMRRHREPEENKMQSGSRPEQQKAPSQSPENLAQQLGVKITDVVGTGEQGEVTSKDVRAHAKKVRDANQQLPHPISSPKREPST